MLNIISLGAGVQSSTMALMAAHGEITPMPAFCLFADTQAEPLAVYRWIDWLEDQLPFPIIKVTQGSLETALLMPHGRIATPPFFTATEQGPGPLRQQCTGDFKIKPIRRLIKTLLGEAILWIGISTDEASRVKDSEVKYITNRHPLIELSMSRARCLAWLKRNDYPEPPKSACIFCPWTDSARWRTRKLTTPDEFARAVNVDEAIRHGLPGVENAAFVHRSLMPLDQIDFSNDEDRGQLNMFENDCEGMCGV